MLRHRFWSVRPCIAFEPVGGACPGGPTTLRPYIQPPLPSWGFEFCFRLIYLWTVIVIGLWNPKFKILIIHLQLSLCLGCFYLVLACVLPFTARISLISKVNRIVTRLITRGDVVLKLQGSGLCDMKPDRCVALQPNHCLPRPNRRSGTASPSSGN